MKFKSILLLCMAGLAFASCGNDDNNKTIFTPTLPTAGGKAIVSISRLGSIESGYDWNFTYTDGRMTKADGVLRDPSVSVDQTFTYTSTFSYGERDVTLNSTTGEKITLHLNADGYISKMMVNRNVYTFQYNYSGQLSAWSKQIFEESLGQIQQYNSSATIDYDTQGAFQKIVYKGNDNRQTVLTFTSDAQPNNNGIMHPTIARELGCIGFEQLYYAGLLGRPARMLVKTIKYDYYDDSNSISSTANVDFEYGYQNGDRSKNVTYCTYHVTGTNEVASVSYKYE